MPPKNLSPPKSSTDFPTKRFVTIKTRTTRTKTIYSTPTTKTRQAGTMCGTLKINTTLPEDKRLPPDKPESPDYVPPPVDGNEKPPPTKPDSSKYNSAPGDGLPTSIAELNLTTPPLANPSYHRLPIRNPMEGWTVEKEHAKVGGPWFTGAKVNPDLEKSIMRNFQKTSGGPESSGSR